MISIDRDQKEASSYSEDNVFVPFPFFWKPSHLRPKGPAFLQRPLIYDRSIAF